MRRFSEDCQMKEALKLALEALEAATRYGAGGFENAKDALREAQAAQPAVPDAFGTREGEHPQYIQGWNDCRAEMLKARGNT
jgi:hypothetical protein